ncbi:hypothetical protein Rhe02_41720 [Rhizocola hellebori]|uniref:S1 family peptidase n=1 Tax=Rhizocola hellebori TaxID=1392758 RepID=A0A8J3Q8Z3_9ACTN|nr:S1 family peptidase [Rhizocola hellebori]GIH06105.1 hypothetical protein Rhe02_41720 [Rhizocola hellebori]
MHPPLTRLAVALALVASAVAVPATALASEGGAPVSALYAQAMTRDLGVDATQVEARLAVELKAAKTEEKLSQSLGSSYGGAWFDESASTLVVGITDAKQAARVAAAGATPKLVKHSVARLSASKNALDRAPRPAASDITSWYVDPATNSVVVTARPGADNAVKDFIAASGADRTTVKVEQATASYHTTIDSFPATEWAIYGGSALLLPNGSCSSGFAVWRASDGVFGMTTAGHCGTVNTPATFRIVNGPLTEQGTFRNSMFPGSGDMAFVSHDSYQFEGTGFVLQQVLDYTGRAIPVDGLQEAAVGASICHSGISTGFRCGRITARNVTVNYVEGPVTGLTQTSACGDFGDSGGPYLAGTQAQGTVSGGDRGCSSGGRITFFQPIRPVLQAYGLNLMTRFGPMPG